MMRFVHLIVVAALVAAAVYVYKIKFESTVQAERVAKLAAEIRRERDAVAALRAEWAQLDNPARIQALAQRHLALKMLDPAQIEQLDRLPERPPPPVVPQSDAIASIIDALEPELPTGAAAGPVPAAGRAKR
jgi:cell division protein FtsL